MQDRTDDVHRTRPEVRLSDSLLKPLLRGNVSAECYMKAIVSFEKHCERKLGEVLRRLGISATVKTDRYSLPYQRELIYSVTKDEVISNTYKFERVAREITRELLNERIYKVRFYLFINIITNEGLAKIEYRFRYHQNLNQ